MDDLDNIVRQLEASGDYRILRRMSVGSHLAPYDGSKQRLAIYVDLETTGLNPDTDEIIEIGMVPFYYNPDGRIFSNSDQPYSALREPTDSILEEVTKITGITQDMVLACISPEGHRSMNVFRIVMLGAISCLILPAVANAWAVGERGEANSVFLYDEPIEGVYGNSWWGTAVSSGESGQINIYIHGEGKTVDFDGILSLNCENPSGYFWKTASNFETPVMKKDMIEILPNIVLQNARKLFCKQN